MKRTLWIVLAASAALISCAKEEAPEQKVTAPATAERTLLDCGVKGVANVMFDDSLLDLIEQDLLDGNALTKSAELNSVKDRLGILYMERVFHESPEFEERHRAAGLHRWYRVHFREDVPVTKVAEGLMSATPGIVVVNPVIPIERKAIFNDPLFGDQWHYNNTSVEWADVNVVPVWENYTKGSEEVIVCVVDEGVQLSHPDLADNCIPGGPEGSQNFMLSRSNPNNLTPGSHGTHVAGTIAAVNNNGKGVVGLAGGDAANNVKGVKIMSCEIFEGKDSNAYVEDAIAWGADHGAVISQNSWGFNPQKDGKYDEAAARQLHEFYIKPNDGEYSDPLKSAIDYFNDIAGRDKTTLEQTGPMAGGVVFFAAGNESSPYGAPGCYPGAIAVGAMGPDGERAKDFSNYGDWVDIAAPGVQVLSSVLTDEGSYGYSDGTSMACPHVSGVAALVVSYCGGMGFTREHLIEKILNGANDTDFNVAANQIGPLVDALGAIKYGEGNPPQPVTDATYSVKSNNVTASFSITADSENPDTPAYGFRIFAAKTKAALENLNPIKPASDVTFGSVLTGEKNIGDKITATVKGLAFNTDYYVAVSANDYGRNFSALSTITKVKTGTNHAPEITVDYVGEIKVSSFETKAIPVSVTDPDDHELTVTTTPGSDYAQWSFNTVTGLYSLTISGRNSVAGTYKATVKAEDPYGLSASKEITYTILPNQAPVIVKPFENQVFYGEGEKKTINLDDYITDPDGETINYTFDISTQGVVHISQSGSTLHLTSLTSEGNATVTLVGEDSGGESVTGSFVVLVRKADVALSTYPNPVVNTLYVATGAQSEPATIRLYTATGNKVYETQVTCSAFSPARIDMTYFAPGRYTLEVSYGSVTERQTIIKR